MADMQIERSALLSSASRQPPPASRATPGEARRWRHPFDSATGTIALGVLLTILLVLALRLFSG
jgi:hypothetical protein